MMSSQTKCSLECSCSVHCTIAPKEFQLPPSPCPDLLVTNSAPSDFQTNEIYKVILDAEEEGFTLDDEIADMRRALDRLELQRAKLGDFVEAHRGVVSTVRRLPSDILGVIFLHYLDASASRAHSPEALSHLVGVCGRWRTIALASAMLWRHICPHIREDLTHDSQWEMQRIALQLQRSAPAALSISLHATSVNIMDLLLTESRRWQTLHLSTRLSFQKHLIMSRAKFPLLEKLTLVLVEPLREDTSLLFESLPALVDLTLRVNAMPIPSTLDFIWAQLRACTLYDCRRRDILRILPLFSAGTRVCFEGCPLEDGQHLTPVHTIVSDLSLCNRNNALATLLGALIAPCLKRFYISGIDMISIPSLIAAFFDRSSCTLTHLGFGWHYSSPDDSLSLLRSPCTVGVIDFDFDLQHYAMPDKVAEALATRDILPNLRTLALRRCERLDDATVLAIHANRRPVLQSLWLQSPTMLSQDTVQALKIDGLEVVTFSAEI